MSSAASRAGRVYGDVEDEPGIENAVVYEGGRR
jgi:hypothetical protein